MLQSVNNINILLYHQIGEMPTDDTNLDCFCSTTEFYQQMNFLKQSDYRVISLKMALDLAFNAKEINENYIVITFDDGCEKFYDTTFPILDSFNFPATVYPITGFLGDIVTLKGKSYPHLKILSESMLLELSNVGVEIGAHTVNHLKLTETTEKEAKFQIKYSKEYLEQLLGKKIDSFSYPHGDYNTKTIRMVKESGFTNALTCKLGFAQDAQSIFEIPRKYITYFDNIESFIHKLN
jgi:peptidoglycan/xylan/chitin deacetylase (PgdA/CDA1 family)